MIKTKPKPCKHCGSNYHQSFACPTRRKPISAHGKQAAKWYKTKVAWSKLNEAERYICHYCGISMTQFEMTLDHLIPRSRAPELRYALSNLTPCCWPCNGLKGSTSHDEYQHTCHTELPVVS